MRFWEQERVCFKKREFWRGFCKFFTNCLPHISSPLGGIRGGLYFCVFGSKREFVSKNASFQQLFANIFGSTKEEIYLHFPRCKKSALMLKNIIPPRKSLNHFNRQTYIIFNKQKLYIFVPDFSNLSYTLPITLEK